MPSRTYWPSMTDYQEALQQPALTFTSVELQRSAPVENKLGLPRPICGSFASVYELVGGKSRWAVKCFLRNIPDLHNRYAKISDHLRKHRRLAYFVTFEYQDEAIRVRGQRFPLVQMEWVEGCQLNTFIEQNLSSPRTLEKLSKRWDRLLADLRSADIAHGDLQHGNVLVRPNGDIRLIDYDGMWVPTLEGEPSNETGHQDYQNPGRTQRDFHSGIDEFAGTVIQIAIAAVTHNPSLWQKYNNGDNLLFRRKDFVNPKTSPLIADLLEMNEQPMRERLDVILNACKRAKRARRSKATGGTQRKAATNPGTAAAKAGASQPASWLADHVEDYGPAPQAPPQKSSGFLGKVIKRICS